MATTANILTLAFLCFSVLILYLAFRARKQVILQQARIDWVFHQSRRALQLIASKDPNEVLTGLQILSVFDIPSIRIKAFPQLMELRQSSNSQVAQLAKHVIELSQTSDGAETNGTSERTVLQSRLGGSFAHR